MTITAHDVRRIKICSACGELGIYKPKRTEVSLPIVVCTNSLRAPGMDADYQHPRCYAGGSTTKLIILPEEERGFIRLSDVSSSQMKGLMVAAKKGKP